MASSGPSTSYTLPHTIHSHTSPTSPPTASPQRKSWKNRLNFPSSHPGSQGALDIPGEQGTGPDYNNDTHNLGRHPTNTSTKTAHVSKWWKVRLFRGMVNDVRRRAPFYVSDWVDAWDYRVVPATVYMYFAK